MFPSLRWRTGSRSWNKMGKNESISRVHVTNGCCRIVHPLFLFFRIKLANAACFMGTNRSCSWSNIYSASLTTRTTLFPYAISAILPSTKQPITMGIAAALCGFVQPLKCARVTPAVNTAHADPNTQSVSLACAILTAIWISRWIIMRLATSSFTLLLTRFIFFTIGASHDS